MEVTSDCRICGGQFSYELPFSPEKLDWIYRHVPAARELKATVCDTCEPQIVNYIDRPHDTGSRREDTPAERYGKTLKMPPELTRWDRGQGNQELAKTIYHLLMQSRPVFLHGPADAGKTWAAVKACTEHARVSGTDGLPWRYVKAPRMFLDYAAYREEHFAQSVIHVLGTTTRLIIDDLAVHKCTEREAEFLLQVVEARVISLRHSVWISTKPPEQLATDLAVPQAADKADSIVRKICAYCSPVTVDDQGRVGDTR